MNTFFHQSMLSGSRYLARMLFPVFQEWNKIPYYLFIALSVLCTIQRLRKSDHL
jgi:hypothetical protein